MFRHVSRPYLFSVLTGYYTNILYTNSHSLIGGEFFDCVCTKIRWRIRDIYHHHSKSKRTVKIVFVYSKKVQSAGIAPLNPKLVKWR
jgi:hypothetical protein